MRKQGYRFGLAVAIATVAMSIMLTGLSSQTDNSHEVVRHWFDLLNRGEWRQAAELFAPDVQHRSGNWKTGSELVVRGRTGLAGNLEDIYRTFPDWKMEIVDMVAEGDRVVVRCRVSGTHQGMATRAVNGGLLVGVQPTGKHFVVQHTHWFTVHDGQIVEHAASRDDLGMSEQLGLLPASARR